MLEKMYAVGRIGSYLTRGVSTVSGSFHPFGGAVDIIVVEQPDGSFKSSPWYVRFGNFQGVLNAKEKIVNISVNGVEADIYMYLDRRGEAYFLQEATIDREESEPNTTSSSSCDETDRIVDRRPLKSNSFNFELKDADLIEFSRMKIVERTNSRWSRILGLVFGRRLSKADNFDGKDSDPRVDRVDSLEHAEIAADLLEMRWSTNIPAKNYRKGGSSRFSAPMTFDSESKADEVMVTIDDNSVVLAYSDDSADNTSKKNDAACEVALNLREIDVNMQFDEYEVSNTSVDDAKNTRELPHQEACDKHEKVSVDGVTISETHGEVMSEVIICTKEYVGDSVNQEVNSSVVTAGDAGLVLSTADLVEFEESETNTFSVDCPNKIEVDFVDGNFSSGKASNSQLQDLEFHERVDPAFAIADEISLEVLASVKSGLYPQGETNEHQEGNLEVDRRHCDSQTVPLGRSLHDLQHEDPAETKFSFPEASETTNEVEFESISYMSGPSQMNCLASVVNISKDNLSKELQLNTFDSYSPESNGADDVLSKSPRALSQQSSEDEQFQLSDIDGCKPIKTAIASTASTDSVNQWTPLPVSMGSSEHTDASDQESSTEDENSKGKREHVSSAINIITGPTIGSEEGMRLAKSLPDLRLQHGSFESCGPDHLMANLLNSNYKSLEFAVHCQDDTSIKSDNVKMENLGSREVGTGDNHGLAYKKIESIDPSVEVSLCRHLLYEGMGSEAASQIFDAAKLDSDSFSSLGPSVVSDDRLVVRLRGLYFPWDAASSVALGMVSFGSDEIFEPKGMIAVDKNERPSESLSSKAIVPVGGSWRWPFSFKWPRSRKVVNDGRNLFAGNVIGRAKSMAVRPLLKTKAQRMVRVMVPTSDQLASLNLKEGCNSIAFSFCTAMLGTHQVDARIYLLKWNSQVIISDVDGTITKSDVLGQFMPLFGMDWSQTGVAHLYSAIKDNGYQLLFLSARAISQGYQTRQFLFNLKQDGKSLPDGPVVISPNGLFSSLYREVIRRAPHEFKIATLQDIRDLFPADHNPFYAGFGNRNTDEISYLKVGIPKGKIFTINPKGEIAVNKHINTRSYTTLRALVNGMFPPITSFEQEDFNSWNYWKLPPPDIDI